MNAHRGTSNVTPRTPSKPLRSDLRFPASITSVDAPRLVSSDASPTRPECAVTRLFDEAWMTLQVATDPPVVVTHIPLGDVPPASACTATPTTSATVAVAPQFPITLGESNHQ